MKSTINSIKCSHIFFFQDLGLDKFSSDIICRLKFKPLANHPRESRGHELWMLSIVCFARALAVWRDKRPVSAATASIMSPHPVDAAEKKPEQVETLVVD